MAQRRKSKKMRKGGGEEAQEDDGLRRREGVEPAARTSPTAQASSKPLWSIRHTDSSAELGPPLTALSALFDELRTADQEHGDVAVCRQDSGWFMSAHRGGTLVFEQLDGQGGPFHMIQVPKERVLALWRRLIDGDVDGLLADEPWRPGYT
jgi:hypothetical protein